MKKILLLIILLSLFITNLYCNNIPNTIYLSVDGLSRQSLSALLNRNKLPNIQKIINKGSFRNMDIKGYLNESYPTYVAMLTGYSLQDVMTDYGQLFPLPENITIFERLKQQYPELQVKAFFSKPQNFERIEMSALISSKNISRFCSYSEVERTTWQVYSLISNFLKHTKQPFFMFANFTETDYNGHKFRNGAERYSNAIYRFDHILGKLLKELEKRKMLKNTHIILTTNYGFEPNSREHTNHNKSFVISSFKIRYKRYQTSLVPTIYKLYGLPYKEFIPKLNPNLLIY
jgi:hypothetical protein